MSKKKYVVFDSLGNFLRYFNTWKEAQEFKLSKGRMDWPVKEGYISYKSETEDWLYRERLYGWDIQ